MATSNPPTRMSRLGVFTSRHGPSKPGPSSSLSRVVADHDEEDDWYIPYNGPYEEPSEPSQRGPRDSWGDLLNGWLSEEEAANARGALPRDGRSSQAASAPEDRARSRVISSVSRQTHSTGGRTTQIRSSTHPRMPSMSYTTPDPVGGVGESPMPSVRSSHPLPEPPPTPPPSQPPPTAKRGSLASIFTFGRRSMRLSTSAEHLSQSKRERANTDATPPTAAIPRPNPTRVRSRANTTTADPSQRLSDADEYYNSYYSTLKIAPGDEAGHRQDDAGPSHPYAYHFPETAVPEPHSAPAAVEKGKGRLLNPKISFNLLDPRGASKDIPAYLKPSPRNSLLKSSISTPNLRNIPKGKHRWWAAETWCDAIMFPRPRFALRFVDSSGSGRIVSPPPSPIMFTSQTPTMGRKPEGSEPSLKKARSIGNLMSSTQSHSPDPQVEEVPVAGPSTRRPPRPKSFAWDDLALPSPVPSLAKVLEEGRQLETQRKQWQTQANRSYLDKRAGTMSRARSKSFGAGQARPRTRSKEHESAFERFAERTLLGNQTRPPTIHVRGPSTSHSRDRSQSQSRSHTQTQTQTQTQTHTQTQTQTGTSRTGSRSRSHAHSNSLGNSWASTSNERGGGHSRSQSVGKTAFKIVVTTASSAAALCGLSQPSPSSEKQSPFDEKRPGVQSPDARPPIPQFEEQTVGNVIVISPTSASAALAMVTPRREEVSPTPSALSGSAEGIGLAISSPSEDHSRQQGREPIRIPTHPYAQNYQRDRAATVQANGAPLHAGQSNAPGQEQSVNMHRQPVVHPYSQPGHPYASLSYPAASAENPFRLLAVPPRLSPAGTSSRLYAELTPGSVREFDPDEIRYSPDVAPPVVVSPKKTPPASGHPYGPPTNRMSELGFGEALMHTMRRTSVDSGLGTSESGGGLARGIDWEPRAIDLSPDNDIDDVVRIHRSGDAEPEDYFRPGGRPGVERQMSDGVVSYQTTTASSPPENLNPPAFRRTTSGLTPSRVSSKSALGNSSGSSPGMVSHESSPPLSPRPINTNEDLERYRDLFYRPTERTTINLDDYGRSPIMSRLPSGSIPFDVSSQSSRSALTRSGLSDLARQLSEDLEELRRERGSSVSDTDSQMWGRRFGGLRGSRPEDLVDPNVVLAQLASENDSPGPHHSPLHLPIDTSFVSPATNVPEDIESSRASSILEASIPDHPGELVRMGEVGAALTPPAIANPQRFSTQLSLVGHGGPDDRPISNELAPPRRIQSQQSALLTPLTPNTRSSYMTSNTDLSRMSGLSDFPAPPSNALVIPPSSTIANKNLRVPPPLTREFSQDTFGRQTDDEQHIGEAL